MAKVTKPDNDILERKEERRQLAKARRADAMKASKTPAKSKKKGSKDA